MFGLELGTLGLFALASAAIVVVPGPTVTVIIANSLAAGSRAGLMNIVGTQIGLAMMLLALAFGFGLLVERLGALFEIVRVIGALYLVWLGLSLMRANGSSLSNEATGARSRGDGWYVRQGLFVILANPKALVFFGAFLPQFVDASQPIVPQLVLLGATFMAIGAVLDGAYALLAGRAGRLLTRARARVVERCSGLLLIGGGLWLVAGVEPPASSG